MGLNLKKWFSAEETDIVSDTLNDQFYDMKASEALDEDGTSKLVLLEPRAYSETQQIADQLKARNTVVVNLKRVTSDQAKRIMDFLSGTIYAIKGNIQKIGSGIFLCTPNNINVQGKITDESEKDKEKEVEEEMNLF